MDNRTPPGELFTFDVASLFCYKLLYNISTRKGVSVVQYIFTKTVK